MKDEIKDKLAALRIEGRQTRKRKARNVLIIFVIVVVSYFISTLDEQLGNFLAVTFLVGIMGGIYILIDAVPSLVQPLPKESYAFKKMVSAIELLENSKSEVVYIEAANYLKHAHKLLKEIELDELRWYERTNRNVKEFIENLQLVIIPATANAKIELEDLEKSAIALSSMDDTKLAKVNDFFEKKTTYEKTKPPPERTEVIVKKLRESKLSKIGYSLALGYVVIVSICAIYVVLTGLDFLVFIKANPAIVIGGGLGLSGLTFWKT
jgi:hypothetical protein